MGTTIAPSRRGDRRVDWNADCAAIASAAIPGIGPIIAAGRSSALPLPAPGGRQIGHKWQDSLSTGLPRAPSCSSTRMRCARGGSRDRPGRERHDAEIVRAALDAAGAERLDAAREAWWVGLRDEEARTYAEQGGDFAMDEPITGTASRRRSCPSCASRGRATTRVVELADVPCGAHTAARPLRFERG